MLFILHQSYLNQIMVIFLAHTLPLRALPMQRWAHKTVCGCNEQQVLCADQEISCGEFLPPKFSSPYVTCPIYREKQKLQTKKIMLLTIFISSQIKFAIIWI